MHPEVRAARRFHQQVYDLVRTIPAGHVTTYGTIALALGAPGCARQVGNALAALPDYHDVPAHRVVNRSGVLTGAQAFGPPGTMRALLEAEGVTFREDGRVDMARHLWEP
ncbi:MAG TPA: MGMT family protein [Chloroflexota bacterium]|nr:MGMT family protein [Chloroflexota bacterium]